MLAARTKELCLIAVIALIVRLTAARLLLDAQQIGENLVEKIVRLYTNKILPRGEVGELDLMGIIVHRVAIKQSLHINDLHPYLGGSLAALVELDTPGIALVGLKREPVQLALLVTDGPAPLRRLFPGSGCPVGGTSTNIISILAVVI